MKREKTIIRTSLIGIIANLILVGFKATIGIIVGSISIINDAINNLTDALSSAITIIGTKLSNKRNDKKHPFGYGRIEYVTSSLIGAIIIVAGLTAIYESVLAIVDHFKNDVNPDYNYISLIIIGVAIVVKILVGLYFRKKGKSVDSDALIASGTDALGDSILSLATLIGAIFIFKFDLYVEGYLGIIIGLFILKSGIEVIKEAVSSIIGERFDPEETKKIIKDINKIEGVKGTFDLIINSYGHSKYIGSAHILVSNDLKPFEIQTIERNVNKMMYTKHNTIMTVGIYTDYVETKESKLILDYISNMVKSNKNILQMHGFYVYEKEKNCDFDLVISFDEHDPVGLIKEIKKELEKEFSEYTFTINLDNDFSLSE
ncbi:MAG: cation diffusion facilitator family transporter [Acholeplasmatales bacterium]|nr:cation diffusion facilitator family transporter [Acholeplasmatales bacterium]